MASNYKRIYAVTKRWKKNEEWFKLNHPKAYKDYLRYKHFLKK